MKDEGECNSLQTMMYGWRYDELRLAFESMSLLVESSVEPRLLAREGVARLSRWCIVSQATRIIPASRGKNEAGL